VGVGAVVEAVLFDLDDTLVVEQAAAEAAFRATCAVASERHGVDTDVLHQAIRHRARELWQVSPTHPYCRTIGISSWEGLWARFTGDDPNLRALGTWTPVYRREAWSRALADQGVADKGFGELLAATFIQERRARHRLYRDAKPVLDQLQETCRLALVTDGAPNLQREKLGQTGIADYFEATVISGEVGVGKPDPRIFREAFDKLGIPLEGAVMVGDSLRRDIAGAQKAGIVGIWLNRSDAEADVEVVPNGEIKALTELRSTLRQLEMSRESR
jgi:putative hydrolase of the HAD superfamily